MPLKKGFLRPDITLEVLNLDRKKLVFGIFWWLVLSFSIYSVLYIFREGLRSTSLGWNEEDFLVLTANENYFYNFFFAFLAATIAFTAISNQWIRRASTFRNIPRYKKAAIFHDKVSFSWYFIYWVSKMGIFFGVLSCSMGVFSKFSLFPQYSLMFVLILINLFFHQWLKLRLIFKNSILPWMFGTFGAVTFVSFLLAFVNPVQIDNALSKNTITYHLSLDLPILKNGKGVFSRQSFKTNIYVGFGRHNPDSTPQIMVRDFHDPVNNISIDMLEGFVKNERAKFDEFLQDEITWRLNIDKNVKMKYVRMLKNELSRIGARKVQYVGCGGRCNGFTDIVGLSQYLPRSKTAYPEFLDLPSKVDVALSVAIKDNMIWTNDSIVTLKEFSGITRDFILANGANGILEFDVDSESSFEVYINVYDEVVGVIKEVRDDWAMRNFNVHYSGFESYDSAQNHIDALVRQRYSSKFKEKD